jgi:hypothetical protein
VTGKTTTPKRTSKYDQDFVNSVHSLHDDGNSLKELGEIFDLSNGSIKYILYVLKPTFKDNPDIVEWKKQEKLIAKVAHNSHRQYCNNTLRFPTLKEKVGAVFSRWFS